MQRPSLPCLPGFNFDNKVGRTNFHRSQLFDKIHEGVYYLADRPTVGEHSHYPSIYPYDEEQRIPAWLAFDGQRLMFKAFFQESVQERWKSSFQIRVVMISFFLEDGTMKIVEPAIDNSGLEQGVLVRRQRIPMPDPVRYRFYDIIDLNIGKEPEIFGRVYKIVDCDKFTRIFLNRMGIPVPDPIDFPIDPYLKRRNVPVHPKKPNRKVDTLGKFLKYDRKVLKYFGYWDDRESEFGVIHDLELRYYLADDTIEIKENFPATSGKNESSMFLKRMKIPKFFSGINSIGADNPFTVLNVFGESGSKNYYIPDALNTGNPSRDQYKDSDFAIGTRINVFGRGIVITDLDTSTREYYRTKYGIEEFNPLEKPDTKPDYYCSTEDKYKPPPYNGFGSYDDSLGNCFKVIPKPPKIDHLKFFQYDKNAYDSQVLRFRAKMISKIPENSDRLFIIRVFLEDNAISIFELAPRNTGFQRCLFQKKCQIILPGEEIYSSQKPKYYEPHHFFIGACLNLGGFHFRIIAADTYALRYMEINSDKFSKSNNVLIMDKIREALRPVYKEFVLEYQPIIKIDGIPVLSYEKLKEALYKYLQERIVEHEVITIARRYSMEKKEERDTREHIRSIIHTELQRFLWNDLDRLEENINHWDTTRSGYLPRSELYTILRGCRLPVVSELLNCMLHHLKKNDEGKIDCHDLLQFLDVKMNPVTPISPMCVKTSLRWSSDKDQDCCPDINWLKFLEDLNVKEEDPASAVTHHQ